MYKWEDVFQAFTEWGQFADNAGNAIIEVMAELPLLYFLEQVFVGCAYQTKMRSIPGITPYTLVCMFLHNTQ
jgi:hypothetical protein